MKNLASSNDFYTGFSESYGDYASQRKEYIAAVNRFAIDEAGSVSTVIDVGSGDGTRAVEIFKKMGASHLILVDSSDGMLDHLRKIADAVVIDADISSTEPITEEKYDVVLCLWNVLGHVPADKRRVALINLGSLLEDSGFIVLDVNNRYNISQYGLKSVMINIVKDIFSPQDSNGDFELNIDTEHETIGTVVHVFNPFEIKRLIRSANLKILKKRVIDYKDGGLCRSIFGGQLVYTLAKQ